MTYRVACSFCGAPAEQRLDPGKCGVLARCAECSGRRWTLIEADVLDALREMPEASFDALLSDVPYGLGTREPTAEEIVAYVRGESGLDLGKDFMSKDWQIPPVAVWREVYRVLRPGAPLLVFAGPRTQDLISIGMRAAGFEIRDGIVDWSYASGFPKSLDLERAIAQEQCTRGGRHFARALPPEKKRKPGDHVCERTADGDRFLGQGTALKPSREPVILARKPMDGTVAHNAITHGVGGINVDGCRIDGVPRGCGRVATGDERTGTGASLTGSTINRQREYDQQIAAGEIAGRWPANLTLRHLDECRRVGTKIVKGHKGYPNGPGGSSSQLSQKGEATTRTDAWPGHSDTEAEAYDCAPGCPVAEMDRQSGNRPGMSGGGVHRDGYGGGMFGGIDSAGTARNDNGGASRFFFCSKASRAEREFGCERLPARKGHEAVDREEGSAGLGPRAGAGRTADEIRNIGPCVKPIKLTRYLATLALPPPRADGQPRRILIPYAGTGSEMIGALRAGWDEIVGIQRTTTPDEAAYVEIARARLERWEQVAAHLDEAEAVREAEDPKQAARAGQLPLLAGASR